MNMRKITTTIAAGLLAGGLALTSTGGAAQAHTGDLKAEYVCQDDGTYLATYKLQIANTGLNGSTMWGVGTSTFQGTPTSDTNPINLTNGPIPSSGAGTILLGTQVLPGDTKVPPWVYAFTTWTDGFEKGSDGRVDSLKGDCEPPPTPPFCDTTSPGPGSVKNWITSQGRDHGGECFEVEFKPECGVANGLVTKQVTPQYAQGPYRLVWREGTETATGYKNFPAEFDEDYNGGSVDITYFIVGPEKDWLVDAPVPNFWTGNGITATIDTDCEPPPMPEIPEPSIERRDIGTPECGDTTIQVEVTTVTWGWEWNEKTSQWDPTAASSIQVVTRDPLPEEQTECPPETTLPPETTAPPTTDPPVTTAPPTTQPPVTDPPATTTPPVDTPDLPNTGGSSTILVLAAVFLAAGTGALAVARRR